MKPKRLASALLLVLNASCHSQTSKIMYQNTSNPLLCDPEVGVCEMPAPAAAKKPQLPKSENKLKLLYFTDPICSSCWGIEPQLRKLKLEYGDYIEIDYRMGGLLRDWSYNSGGISKPSDVAHHWDEVSAYYDMPIDGDVWLEDPLDSSFPPSIAIKAAQLQDKAKAVELMRRLREMVFLEKKNIAKWEHIAVAVQDVGLDLSRLQANYTHKAKEDFEADLQLSRKLGVRGFPTVFAIDSVGETELVYGVKPYAIFEQMVLNAFPSAEKTAYDKSPMALFKKYPTLTTREFSELSGLSKPMSVSVLQALCDQGRITRFDSKNGPIWTIREL